jgi:hypothetical protein
MAASASLATVQDTGCATLSMLVRGKHAAQRLAGELGAVEAVYAALKSHSEHPEVVQHSCVALADLLSLCPENQDRGAKASAAPTLVQLLAAYTGMTGVQSALCGALGVLCMHPESCAAALSVDSLDQVMACLSRGGGGGPELTAAACRALKALCEDAAGAAMADKAGAMKQLLVVMSLYADNAAVGEAALAAVSPLMLDRKSKQRLGEAGFYQRAIALLSLHSSDLALQETGWAAVGNAVYRNLEGAEGAAAAGALPLALSALRTHSSRAAVSSNVLACLGNLCSHTYNQQKCGDLGSLEAVVAAMAAWPDDLGVCENGCAALGNIAAQPNNLERAAESGALEVTVSALLRHAKHSGVCENAIAALGNLCVSPALAARAVALEAIEGVVGAMAGHGGVCSLCEKGAAALRNLTTSFETQNAAASRGGIQVTVEALRVHVASAGMCERGCAAVGNLVFKSAANQALAADAGAVEAVVAAMRAHPGLPAVQERGAAALGNVAFKHFANQQRVAAAGGIEAIVDAMARFSDKAGVQEQGFRALRNLSALDDAAIAAADAPQPEAVPQAEAGSPKAGLAGIPERLRAFAERMRKESGRGCVPLASLMKQLDVAFGADVPVLSDAGALSARVKAAMEALELGPSRAEF